MVVNSISYCKVATLPQGLRIDGIVPDRLRKFRGAAVPVFSTDAHHSMGCPNPVSNDFFGDGLSISKLNKLFILGTTYQWNIALTQLQ
jgi:hypothetical protein